MELSNYIQAYLRGEDLTPDELTSVETALMQNSELANEIAKNLTPITVTPDLQTGINYYGLERLRSTLGVVMGELESEGYFISEADLKAFEANELPDSQRKSIETFIEEEQNLGADLNTGIQLHGKEELKNKLKHVSGDLQKEGFFDKKKTEEPIRSAKVFTLFRVASIAASIALILFAWFMINGGNSVADELFVKNFVPMEDKISDDINDMLSGFGFAVEEEEAQKYKALQVCINTYNDKQFGEAILAFEQYLSQYPDDKDAKVYLAIGYLEQNNPAKAIKWLAPLSKSKGFELEEDVDWYLALAYLKNGEKNKAKELLKSIKTPDYENQIKTLLEEL